MPAPWALFKETILNLEAIEEMEYCEVSAQTVALLRLPELLCNGIFVLIYIIHISRAIIEGARYRITHFMREHAAVRLVLCQPGLPE